MNDTIKGTLVGAVAVIAVLSVLGIGSAHLSGNPASGNSIRSGHVQWQGMMHGMMMGGMSCAGEGIEEMDSNGDGMCDVCGMPIEHCNAMAGGEASGMSNENLKEMHESCSSMMSGDEE